MRLGSLLPLTSFQRTTSALSAVATAGVTALLVSNFERKSEAKNAYVRLVEVTDDDTDPEKWAANWPQQ